MGNTLPPVSGSQPYPTAYGNAGGNRPQPNNGIPGSVKSPGGLVLNFFGSNFTGSNEGVAPPTADSYQPSGGFPQQPYPAAPGMPGVNPSGSTGAPTGLSGVDITDPTKLSPAEQLNALYNKYNNAQRQQQDALKAVQDAERARNDYMALGNTIRNQYQPANQASPGAQMGGGQLPPSFNTTPGSQTPTFPVNSTPGASTYGQMPGSQMAGQPSQVGSAANQPPMDAGQAMPSQNGGLTPAQAALAAQALRQSGLSPQDQSGMTPAQADPTGLNPQQPSASQPASSPQQPNTPQPGVSSSTPGAPQRPQAASVTEPGAPSATPSNLTGAPAQTLNNLIFAPEELVQFKKLTPREQIDWITQRNLQTKADAIGEIAIQSGMPNGSKFPQDTYDRLETIAKLDTKDIKGPAGDDLRYFRKTALWTLGLLNGSQNANTPVALLPAIKTIESIARDPKETTDIRIAAAQALQAVNRGGDPTMKQTLNRVYNNQKSVVKPWTWLRAGTPNDVRKIVDSARKGVPIQAAQPAGDGAGVSPNAQPPASATRIS